ncbi:MAG: hypothetical protein HY928_02965 [Elusimicrobia bacterium]|nr:hypothetical protein [Elusimicrobiota bacterium]
MTALFLLLAVSAHARDPQPLPASPFVEGRVLIDEDAPPIELDEPALKPEAVKRRARGRVASVDAKARKLVIALEDEEDMALAVPDAAVLTFMPDERPLHLDQLRRGDAVDFEALGAKLVRLHLEAAPPRKNVRRRPAPREELPDYDMTPDTEDRPMYMSEPPPEKK